VDEDIAIGVSATEQKQLDLASLLLQGHRGGHRAGGEGRLEGLELFQIRFGLLEVCLQTGLLLRIGSPPDVVLELVDLFREGRQLLFEEWDTADAGIGLGQVLA
jgi:hypothetical protein